MSLTNEQIIEAIGQKSVMEIVELIKACLLYTSDAADE